MQLGHPHTSPTRDSWPAIVLRLTTPKVHLSTLSWGVHVVGGWSSEILKAVLETSPKQLLI